MLRLSGAGVGDDALETQHDLHRHLSKPTTFMANIGMLEDLSSSVL